MLTSILGRDTGCPELKFSWFYLRPSNTVPPLDQHLSLQTLSNASFINHLTILTPFHVDMTQVKREKAKLSLRLIN
jgi:hypothetical protein